MIGRVDDVLKVSGYRLGTAEIESALVSHPAVAEAAAIGLPHDVKGNAIHTYVILQTGIEKSEKLIEELRAARRARNGSHCQTGQYSCLWIHFRRPAAAKSCAGC